MGKTQRTEQVGNKAPLTSTPYQYNQQQSQIQPYYMGTTNNHKKRKTEDFKSHQHKHYHRQDSNNSYQNIVEKTTKPMKDVTEVICDLKK